MIGDNLFPFPEPTFIFVHDVHIIPNSMIVKTRDERGKVVETLPDLEDIVAEVAATKGYLTSPDETRDQTGYINRQNITAVCALPVSAELDHTSLIMCFDTQLPLHLAGIYEIDTVRTTIVHQRAMLRRYRLQFDKFRGVV